MCINGCRPITGFMGDSYYGEKRRGGAPLRYLITGGAGFIGTHLTKRLLSAGHDVIILDDFSAGEASILSMLPARIIKGSVLNAELVSEITTDCDAIIHLAAVVGVRQAMNRTLETLTVSFRGTENVLRAATDTGTEIFVASSSAVYGKIKDVPVTEEADCLLGSSDKPSWTYSAGKLVEEHLATAYHREFGTEVKIGRFFNVIGPHQRSAHGMVVPTFINRALRGEPLIVYGTGHQTRTFAYIEDALDGLELILSKGKTGTSYNIGGTEEVTIQALADRIIHLTGSSSPIRTVQYTEAFDEQFEETLRRMPDISRLRSLGYEPQFSLDQALGEIICHFRTWGES